MQNVKLHVPVFQLAECQTACSRFQMQNVKLHVPVFQLADCQTACSRFQMQNVKLHVRDMACPRTRTMADLEGVRRTGCLR